MKTYTIEQIRKYIESQDSLGDVLYNLSEANIDISNLTDELISEEDTEDFSKIIDKEEEFSNLGSEQDELDTDGEDSTYQR